MLDTAGYSLIENMQIYARFLVLQLSHCVREGCKKFYKKQLLCCVTNELLFVQHIKYVLLDSLDPSLPWLPSLGEMMMLGLQGGAGFKFNYSIQIHTIHHSMSDYDYISMLIKLIIAVQINKMKY